MFLNKVKLRKASSRAALLLATGSLLATGITPAHALDATPLYINFESNDPLKDLAISAQGPFSGTSTEIKASTNLEGDALFITKNGDPWSGVNILGASSTPYGYTAADKKVITFDYWSPDATPSPVMLKLETPGATYKAVEAQPGLNTISVDFSDVASWGGGYTKLIIFPNFREGADATYTGAAPVANTGQVYEVDNISINGGTAADVYVPVVAPTREATSTLLTFETDDALGAAAIGQGFEGAVTAIVDAPAGGNGGKALEIEKAGNPWSGVNLVTAPSTVKFLDATNQSVTLNYYSPESVNTPVQFQLVGSNGSKINQAVEAAPGWQTLTFDFSASYNASVEYTAAVIFPNFVNGADVPGYAGAPAVSPLTGKKYAIDNVGFNGAVTPAITVPDTRQATSTLLTFEAGDTLGASAVGAGFEGAVTAIVDAPAGGNGGKALEIEKAGNAWSGVNLVTAPSTVKFLDASKKTVTLNYYSPETVNTPVQFQLIGADNSKINQAVEAVPGWQKLTFDFSASYNDAVEYTAAAIFPNFVNGADVPGYTGAPAVSPLTGKKYAIDNVGFNGATTPAIAVPRAATSTLLTFETGDTLGAVVEGAPTAQKPQGGFEGATTSIAVAPAGGNGGNALKITKNVGAMVYAGATFIKFGDDKRVTNGTYKTVTFNYYSPKANSPVNVELRPYPNALGKIVNAPLGWSTITVDFTDVAGWTSTEEFTLLSIFPDFNQPAGDTALSYYVDNLAFNGAVTPEIPTVSVPREATSTLLTFETADTLGAKVVGDSSNAKPEGGFEGAVTTIENAPAGGNGGKALKIVKGVGAPTYAGVNVIRFGADKRVTNGTYKTVTFNYYSPKTTSNVRVELRGFPDALGKTVAAPKGWSKITVDFTDVAGWTSTEEFVSVILFPDFDVAGAGDVFYVDNLAFNGATTPAIPLPKVKPTVKTAAAVGGTAKYGKTLTAGKGSWTGTATITYTYKWYRCTVASTKTSTLGSTPYKCAAISGGSKSTYKLSKSDIGKYVRVLITAKNSAGTAYSLSKTTAKVAK
ncbi:MAG: hypothetical protein RIS19_327 [Actinomycetota bacterium]